MAALLLAAAANAPAKATILTFDIAGIANFDDIPGAYGDRVNSLTAGPFSYGRGNGFTPNITVDYRTLSTGSLGTGGGTLFPHLDWWNNNYGDLVNVAYPVVSVGSTGEITFTPDPGFAVRINSFVLAGWPNTDYPNQPLLILDADYNLLQDLGPLLVPGDFTGPRRLTINLNQTYDGPVRIQFGNNWNIGIDNINFDQVQQVAAVPAPPALALALVGGASLLAGRRFRRRTG